MSYTAILRGRRTSSASVRTKYEQFCQVIREAFIIFVEGEEDENFYGTKIEEKYPSAVVRYIICDGKGGVLGARDFVDRKPKIGISCLFFVDRDHESFLGHGSERLDTFVTAGYSFESYFYSKKIVVDAICRKQKIRKSDPIRNTICSYFDESFPFLQQNAAKIFSLVVFARQNDENVTAQNLRYRDIFELRKGGIVRNNLKIVDLLEKLEINNLNIRLSDCRKMAEVCNTAPYERIVRGKFALDFVCDAINSAPRIFADERKIDGSEIRNTSQVGRKNFVVELIQYLDDPPDLIDFIDRHF
jgi:hypothetical protein